MSEEKKPVINEKWLTTVWRGKSFVNSFYLTQDNELIIKINSWEGSTPNQRKSFDDALTNIQKN
tara:strand:+ start:506 stop:697 length:192 start_codon:yes stop_codon:yes gene_type:complete